LFTEIWSKEHDIQNHYMNTAQSENDEIVAAIREAINATTTLWKEEEDRLKRREFGVSKVEDINKSNEEEEYEQLSRILGGY
jgi:hypothetical protein